MIRPCMLAICGVVIAGCGGSSTTSEPVPITIGGPGPGGGTVFAFLDDTNTSGLEVFPASLGQRAWGCVGVDVDEANGTRPTNGIGVPSGAESSRLLFDANASGVCFSEMTELVNGFTNNGLSDWYLPSTDELITIREQGLLPGEPGDSFWSSTEDSAQNAFLVLIRVQNNSFDEGEPSTAEKTLAANVLPIRTFDN